MFSVPLGGALLGYQESSPSFFSFGALNQTPFVFQMESQDLVLQILVYAYAFPRTSNGQKIITA
jgi:hypothetical protein